MFSQYLRSTQMVALFFAFLALAVSALLSIGISPTSAFRVLPQNMLYRAALTSEEPSQRISILAIDDASLAELGRFQDWHRALFAKAIDVISRDAPRAIGLDITFSEPSRNTEDDAKLAISIGKAGNVVLATRMDEAGDMLPPIPQLARFAASLGHVNLSLDGDNAVRRAPLYLPSGDAVIPSFAASLARVVLGRDIEPSYTDDAGQYLFRYMGAAHSFTTFSFADAVQGRIPQGTFRDAIVLIGATPADMRDIEAVPVGSGKMPGVEIHAHALQTLLTSRTLQPMPTSIQFLVYALLYLLCAYALMKKVRIGIMVLIASCTAYALFAYSAFAIGYIADIAVFICSLLLLLIAMYGYKYLFENRSKKDIIRAFGHYVSPELIAQMEAEPHMLQLGGEQRHMTVFFSDLEGFTSLSEKVTPEKLVEVLNVYLGEMTDIILREKGTLDKYIGDAIMAFWGAPLAHETAALAACRAALLQQQALQYMQLHSRIAIDTPLIARMGIATGDMIVGNMGSGKRFNYTVMGDVVNLASRLEGINKSYGTHICLDEETMREAGDGIVVRELDSVRVKGKERAVRIYELVRMASSEPRHSGYDAYEQGLASYRAQQFSEADHLFAKAESLLGQDAPSAVMRQRVKYFTLHPPEKNWDGVYTFTTK